MFLLANRTLIGKFIDDEFTYFENSRFIANCEDNIHVCLCAYKSYDLDLPHQVVLVVW